MKLLALVAAAMMVAASPVTAQKNEGGVIGYAADDAEMNAADGDELHAPHLLDVEVVQVLRRLVRTGEVSPTRAGEAIADLTDLDLHRHAHLDLLGRAWKLRDNIGAYDAVYIALAEAIDAPIVTCDAPLANAPGHRARIGAIA